MEPSDSYPADYSYLDQYLLPNTASAHRELDEFYDTMDLDDQCRKGNAVVNPAPVVLPDPGKDSKSEMSWKAGSPPPQISDMPCANAATSITTSFCASVDQTHHGVAEKPTFNAKVVPPDDYFNPKKGLFWDDRDYARPWYRRRSYDDGPKTSLGCTSDAKSAVESGSRLPQLPADEATSSTSQDISSIDEVSKTPVSLTPTSPTSESPEEKCKSVVYQAPTGSILPSRAARSASVSQPVAQKTTIEVSKCSEIVSQIPFEHGLIFGGIKPDVSHIEPSLSAAADTNARSASLPCIHSRQENPGLRTSSISGPSAIEPSTPAHKELHDPRVAADTVPQDNPQSPAKQSPTPVQTHTSLKITNVTNDPANKDEEMDHATNGSSPLSPVTCTPQTFSKHPNEGIDQEVTDECGSDDEVTLVSPMPALPQVQMPVIASAAAETPECGPTQPNTPLQPRSPTPNRAVPAAVTPCPPPPSTDTPLGSHNRKVKSTSPIRLSPDALRNKGIRGVLRSPKIVPPPQLSQQVDLREAPIEEPSKADKEAFLVQETPHPSLEDDGDTPLSNSPVQSTTDTQTPSPQKTPSPPTPSTESTPKPKEKRKYTKTSKRQNELKILKPKPLAEGHLATPSTARHVPPGSPAIEPEAMSLDNKEAIANEGPEPKKTAYSKKRGRRRSSPETGKPVTRSEKKPRRSKRLSDEVAK